MKTHANLYEAICSFENLLDAAKKAQKGKRFQKNVSRFNVNLENELITLQRELREKTYQPGRYHEFLIYEPKKRTISATPYRDRVVHHALCNIVAPLFERTFIFDSYANRLGKGTHKAILRYRDFCRKNRYALKGDVKKYFPTFVVVPSGACLRDQAPAPEGATTNAPVRTQTSGVARRVVEQQSQQPALRQPQKQRANEPQQ
jgi:hypothetical protein